MNDLIENIANIHTTELGKVRISKNLSLQNEDEVEWCKQKVLDANANIVRNGKNWYVTIDNIVITINAYSYTIITAHKIKSR